MAIDRTIQVPALAIASLVRWGIYGYKPGGALTCAVENNLVGFCCHADPQVLASARDLMLYLIWNLPGQCFGSREACADWPAKVRADRSLLKGWDPFDNLDDALAAKVIRLLGDHATKDVLSLTCAESRSRIERLKLPALETNPADSRS